MGWMNAGTALAVDPEEELRRRLAQMPPAGLPGAPPPTDSVGALTENPRNLLMPAAPPPMPTNAPAAQGVSSAPRAPQMPPAAMPAASQPANAAAPTPDANAMPAAPQPNRSQQYQDLANNPPKQVTAQPLPWWAKALGAASAAAAGYGRKDDTAFNLATKIFNSPQAGADEANSAATEGWKNKLATVQTEAGLDEKGAQTQETGLRSKVLQRQLDTPKPDKPEDAKIGEYTNDEGHPTYVFRKPTGEIYENSVAGSVKEKADPTKTTAELLRQQIDAANAKGDHAAVKSLQKRLKDVDPMGENRLAVTVQGQQNAQSARDDKAALDASKVSRQDVREHDKAYVQPAETVEKSYQMMNNAYNDYKAAAAQGKTLPTGAESMLALSTHLSTTFGNVKGARITKDMIEHHLGARSISDSAQVAIQKLTNGDVLSPDQWDAFHKLIGESRKLSWETATKEANRKQIPIDFLPDDLQGLKSSGKPGGDKIQIHRDANGRITGVE